MKGKIVPILLGALAVFVLANGYGFAYNYGHVLGFRIGEAPDWWLAGADKVARHIAWRHVGTLFGVSLASVPFAIGIAWFKKKSPVRLSFYVTGFFLLAGPFLYNTGSTFTGGHWQMIASWLTDLLKHLFILPLLTMAAVRLLAKVRSRNVVAGEMIRH